MTLSAITPSDQTTLSLDDIVRMTGEQGESWAVATPADSW